MNFLRNILLIFILSACSSGEYKKASLAFYNGYDGYFETQFEANKYILEYNNTSIGNGSYKKHDEITEQFWLRRASELCPNGFNGKPEMIYRRKAKLDILKTDIMGFNEFRIASGIIECKN